MKNMARLQQLQKFLEEDPHDPFNVYALALEYRKHDLKKASELFDQLLSLHKDYLPTYFHAGQLSQEVGDVEKALSIFKTGIELATHKQDFKTLRELQVAYQNLLFD